MLKLHNWQNNITLTFTPAATELSLLWHNGCPVAGERKQRKGKRQQPEPENKPGTSKTKKKAKMKKRKKEITAKIRARGGLSVCLPPFIKYKGEWFRARGNDEDTPTSRQKTEKGETSEPRRHCGPEQPRIWTTRSQHSFTSLTPWLVEK